MSINAALLAEFKYESTNTRKLLEQVPTDKFTWKPHEKSMTLGRLATHIAENSRWIDRIINNSEFDFATALFTSETKENTEELLKLFDEKGETAIKALESASDEDLNTLFTIRRGDHIVVTLPRKVNIRNFALNHTYHHRGQLSVFLRLLNIEIPGMYGPSADEQSF